MISTHEKFVMEDLSRENTWFMEVNWEDDKKTRDCQVVKITFPNGDTAYTKKDHLYSVLFAIGNPRQQSEIIPQKLSRNRWFETILSVKAKKDIAKGENITFPVKLSLPMVEEEIISREKVRDTGLILPVNK